jgi:hypothetical protein
MEEHFPLTLINDWDLTGVTRPESSKDVEMLSTTTPFDDSGRATQNRELSRFKVLVLAGAAALSDSQCEAIREFVRAGGGVVATGETSLCDELGRPRKDFALADLFGISYRGRPATTAQRETLDVNFAITVDENYWKQRVGVATLTWGDSPILDDPKLRELVPTRSVTFKGPQVLVSELKPDEVIARMTPAGWKDAPIPAVIARTFGTGRVVYLPACLDAAMWSYSYPYQRRMLTRLIEWAAGDKSFPIEIEAPMCVQTTFWRQRRLGLRPDPAATEKKVDATHDRIVLHFFNGLNTTANHGLPAVDVPLREETVPIHGIKVHLREPALRQAFIEPGHVPAKLTPGPNGPVIELPPLEIHSMLVLE